MTPRKRFSPSVYRAILIRQRNLCACGCRETFESMADVNFDHVIALADGGEDVPENLQALKLRHHRHKSGKETKARAKVVRIQNQGGLMRKKPSQRDKVMAKWLGLEA